MLIARFGREVEPPWRKEHKLAAAAALSVLVVSPPACGGLCRLKPAFQAGPRFFAVGAGCVSPPSGQSSQWGPAVRSVSAVRVASGEGGKA